MKILLISVWAGALMLGLGLRTHVHASPAAAPDELRFAMVQALGGVNLKDARVAIDMNWTRHLARVFPGLESTFEILSDVPTTEKWIRERRLHGLSIDIANFLALSDRVALTPVFISSRTLRPLEPYLLLVRKGIDWQRLGDNGRRRLMIENAATPTIGWMWLETVLRDRRQSAAQVYFTDISTADKPARVILPVFFGQADACLVPESTYDTMVELNPQIRQRLSVLERSPGFIKTIHCATDQLPRHMADRFLQKGMRMDDSVEGRQLLLIFHVKKNFAYDPAYLNHSQRIYMKYQRINAHAKR